MRRGHLGSNAGDPSPYVFLSFLHIPPAPSFLADSLDGALEAGGGLQLQLVGHGVDLKPVETWDKLVGGPLGPVLGVNHKEHVGEPGAKIGSICVVVSGGLGCVDIHTFRAVELHHGLSRDVGQANRKHGLILTIYSWAISKVSLLVLFQHLCNATVSEDVTSVDEAVEHLGRLLDQVTLVGIILQLFVWL